MRRRKNVPSSSEDEHHHDHAHDHDHHHHRAREPRERTWCISLCTNLSYILVVFSIMFGMLIINERASILRVLGDDQPRILDFERKELLSEKTSPSVHLLFVHGAFGNKDEWTQNFFPFFEKEVKSQGKRIASLASFSMTGHGKSSHSDYISFLRLTDFVDDLESIIEKHYNTIGSDELVLACHSLGGMVCQKYLDVVSRSNIHKVLPRAVILLTSAPPVARMENAMSAIKFDPFISFNMLMELKMDPIVMKTIKHTKHFLFHEKTTEEEVQKIAEKVPLSSEGILFYLDCLTTSINTESIVSLLRSSEKKFDIAIISIEKDPFFSKNQHDKMTDYWKLVTSRVNEKTEKMHIREEIIPNSVQLGHQVMLDKEWKVMAQKIQEFISKL